MNYLGINLMVAISGTSIGIGMLAHGSFGGIFPILGSSLCWYNAFNYISTVLEELKTVLPNQTTVTEK